MRFWPGKFSESKAQPRDRHFQEMKSVVQTMNSDQLRRMSQLLADGIALDNAKAQRTSAADEKPLCLTDEPPSPTP
jgi:hypothetical protein